MRRLSRLVLTAAGLVAASIVAPSPTIASMAHPGVVSPDPANYTPNVMDDGVGKSALFALAQSAGTLFAGGNFQRVTDAAGTTSYSRSNIMGFSATTGAMSTTFAPDVAGQVWAIEPSGASLYIGGTFTTVNGVTRRGVAKIDATTGAVDPVFNAKLTSGRVTEIRLVNGRLIIGGTFPKKLLALDPVTGADTGYISLGVTGSLAGKLAGPVGIYRFAVDSSKTHLVAIGNFTTIGGQVRSRVFMADLGPSSATVDPWYYKPFQNMCAGGHMPDYVRDVDFSPDGNYFVIVSTGFVPLSGGLGRDICDAAARFETGIAAPNRPTWINYTGGDTLHSVAVTGSAVYVQGHQRWLDNPNGRDNAGPGAVSRPGIGAIDPATGKALSWNPTKSRAVGGRDFLATAAGLWVASDGARFKREYRNNIAFCPLV